MSSNYIFDNNGTPTSFDDVFVSAKKFQQGTAWVWGDNGNTQLGVDDDQRRSSPVVLLSGAQYWKELCNARFSGYGIASDGQMFCWGNNSFGQLGTNGVPVQATTPVVLSVDKTWRSLSKGGESFIGAIKTDGTLWMWGLNSFGQLGTNDANNRLTPVTTFSGGNSWKQVSCGRHFAAAIKTDGSLWVWGSNYAARLGIGTAANPPTDPVGTDIIASTPITTFAGGNDWKSVSCGYAHVLAIKNDGKLYAWGVNDTAQCGQNPSQVGIIVTIPTEVEPGFVWKTASAGRFHSAAIKDNGSLWVWGRNTVGQLGIGNVDPNIIYTSPFQLYNADFGNNFGSGDWKDVACGQLHTVALKSNGSLWAWGSNLTGQIGIGNTLIDPVSIPTKVSEDTNWRTISVGPMSLWTLAAKYDGTALYP
jgi:alpha-tubulin suppressor-like RCC1 family protein